MGGGGGVPFQQEDNASWKCSFSARECGWMMTGDNLRGDDSRGTRLKGGPRTSGIMMLLFVSHHINEK